MTCLFLGMALCAWAKDEYAGMRYAEAAQSAGVFRTVQNAKWDAQALADMLNNAGFFAKLDRDRLEYLKPFFEAWLTWRTWECRDSKTHKAPSDFVYADVERSMSQNLKVYMDHVMEESFETRMGCAKLRTYGFDKPSSQRPPLN